MNFFQAFIYRTATCEENGDSRLEREGAPQGSAPSNCRSPALVDWSVNRNRADFLASAMTAGPSRQMPML